MKNKNIIIAASGTGGHIYPGIALAQELREKGYVPFFFVSNNEASKNIIKNSGFNYEVFNLSGMPRKISFSFIVFLVKLFFSYFKALKNIIKMKPVAVVGVGGYISVPAVLAAKTCCKKTFIHEQNTIPGEANKLLNRFADKTLTSFKDSAKYFKKRERIVLTGYPVRREILSISKDNGRAALDLNKDMFTLMVFGGSLGAVKVNETAFETFQILSDRMDVQVIHITGKNNYDAIKLKTKDTENYHVFEYMHNISDAYAAADVVVCRSGAGTVFELLLLNKPAILIPYPYATANHQYHNAKEVTQSRHMLLVEEKDLTPAKLAELVELLKNDSAEPDEKLPTVHPQEIMADEIIKNIQDKI